MVTPRPATATVGKHTAHAIETAVLSEMGAGSKPTSKEQADLVKGRVRKIVYDADSGKVRIEMIKPPDAGNYQRL